MPEIGHAMSRTLKQKCEATEALIREVGRALIAFSGGVDSTLLAKVTRDLLGRDHALAVTADSPSLAREDLAEACRLAEQLDLEHRVITTRELEDPAYQANTGARCYFCKRELFQELEELAAARRFPVVLYGAIWEDRSAERPGQRAASQCGVRAPLQEAGLTKREVREWARQLGLPNWNRPQNACLSSRIPHGQVVTEEKLRQIEAAETLLRARHFRQVRVRHLGRHARIEVGGEEVGRFQDPALIQELARGFARIGFETVGVDRSGYRAGGANRPTVDEVLLTTVSKC